MKKILLIEDDRVQVEIIRRHLEAEGYKVLVVSKALEGLEIAKREKPSLIIMDMILPGMHGLEASIKLLEMPETKDIPVVALSGMGLPKFVEECYRVGIKDYLKKPCDPRQLLKVVEKYAGKPKREGVVVIISTVSPAYTQLVMHLSKMRLKVESISAPLKTLVPLLQLKPKIIFFEVLSGAESEEKLIRQIKTDKSIGSTPVVIFSSKLEGEKLKSLSQELGADESLTYPFDYFSITDLINRYLAIND